MARQSKSDETILYVIANERLGWRKIGIGFGHRLEKWRSEGWVLEQQALFSTRTHAALAEQAVKMKLAAAFPHGFADRPREKLSEGSTEAWPYDYETIDLAQIKEATETFISGVHNAMWTLEFSAFLLLFNSIKSDYENDEPGASAAWDGAQDDFGKMLKHLAAMAESAFIESPSPNLGREQVATLGLDWDTLLRKRQDHWTLKAAKATGPLSPPGLLEGRRQADDEARRT
jgi:hypothetical protein